MQVVYIPSPARIPYKGPAHSHYLYVAQFCHKNHFTFTFQMLFYNLARSYKSTAI